MTNVLIHLEIENTSGRIIFGVSLTNLSITKTRKRKRTDMTANDMTITTAITGTAMSPNEAGESGMIMTETDMRGIGVATEKDATETDFMTRRNLAKQRDAS